MILFWAQKETDTKYRFTGAHFFPFDAVYGLGKTQAELEAEGAIFVDAIITQEDNGKNAQLFINPQTKEQWYEYSDRPPTPDERIAQLEAEKVVLQQQAAQQNADFTAFTDFFFASFPNLT